MLQRPLQLDEVAAAIGMGMAEPAACSRHAQEHTSHRASKDTASSMPHPGGSHTRQSTEMTPAQEVRRQLWAGPPGDTGGLHNAQTPVCQRSKGQNPGHAMSVHSQLTPPRQGGLSAPPLSDSGGTQPCSSCPKLLTWPMTAHRPSCWGQSPARVEPRPMMVYSRPFKRPSSCCLAAVVLAGAAASRLSAPATRCSAMMSRTMAVCMARGELSRCCTWTPGSSCMR